MANHIVLVVLSYFTLVHAQQIGTLVAETHPPLAWQKCVKGGKCQTTSAGVVLDANWRWVHTTTGSTNCYTGNTWNTALCPDDTTCANNCAVDGADYAGTYGITTSGNALTLKFVTQSSGKNIGSRVYLTATNSSYQIFKLLNQEFSFDVDVSNLPCGLNGALYLAEMDADGGLAKFPTNKAGAKYGTGYCDSQCPKDLKFINGLANAAGWTPSSTDPNGGTGTFGSCCNEMDIWEANSVSAAYTPHPCSVAGQTRCSGTQCSGTGELCDPAGCDFNSYRMGNKTFYGKGHTVDTTSKFTVVTQFITSDNTATGTLSEIRRLYVQNGKIIQNSAVNVPGVKAFTSVSDAYCTAQKAAFGDANTFKAQGGMAGMSKALSTGMVLVLSVWDDHTSDMRWLDSNFPTTSPATQPGVARGTCSTTSGVPSDIETNNASASVTFSNIKFGDIGSTFSGTAPTA